MLDVDHHTASFSLDKFRRLSQLCVLGNYNKSPSGYVVTLRANIGGIRCLLWGLGRWLKSLAACFRQLPQASWGETASNRHRHYDRQTKRLRLPGVPELSGVLCLWDSLLGEERLERGCRKGLYRWNHLI